MHDIPFGAFCASVIQCQQMDRLITNYRVQLAESACGAGTRWGAQATLADNISAVLPYLNAVLDRARYDHQNEVLIWEDKGQKYAFRPTEIRVAQVKDPENARRVVTELVDKVNRVWQERDNISPSFAERKPAPVIDIFKLLPRTNCRQCGYPTCMAYAADLSKGLAQLEQCPALSQTEHSENREKLLELVKAD